ncbi:alpha/beta fold hydrolase [Foetidibacter luteolus]|uniref:alpha/beta fold hydrolase n=1 Tax=Foetidibacter luteolus TaxID=2608880 RepID=UPI00129AD3DE|nr:alpha/beta hydrolase [Foetidibacter luteolus]
MKRIGRFLLRLIVICMVLFIVALMVLDRFVQFRMSDKEYLEYFAEKGLQPHIGYYNTHQRNIRYASIGKDTSATLFFIHGAPSSFSYYKEYMSDSLLLARAAMFAVDRPGYGYSDLGHPEPSIEKQVQMIVPVLDSLNKVRHPVIIVGASYGTSVACRLVMDHPELADGLVLIAPALAPGEEKTFWFTHMIESPALNWFIPRMLQSANTEKVHHKEELAKMLPYWNKINIPVIYLQGEKDELVYTSNAQFAKTHLTNAPYLDIQMLKGRGHVIAYLEKDRIKQSILKMLDLSRLNIAGKLKKNINVAPPLQGGVMQVSNAAVH